MYANYHTHTYLCHHAQGTPREYIENAIAGGIKLLGFADHVPYPLAEGYQSRIRMSVSETEKYITMLCELRDEFKDEITIYIGYEAEYYPKHFTRMLENIRRFPCDYLILGQHSLGNEYDLGIACLCPTEDKALLTAYVDQTIEGMNTGVFTYLAHPDVIGYCGDDEFYVSEMTRLCEAAKSINLPLELNLLGIMQKRLYPRDIFWQIVALIGNRVILGCDAHFPEVLSNAELVEKGLKYAESFGITLMTTVELKPLA